MKKLLVFILLLFHLSSTSQEINNLKKIVNLSIDPFENIFLCEEKKIIKIIKSDNKRLEYDFSEFGKLTKLITENPLRTTLFFKESQTIIFLDKNLNKLNIELKVQHIQNNIISDVETHSNLIFLLSEKTNEICTYNLKKLKITNCNKNIQIKKEQYLKLFLNKETLILLNNDEALILDDNLIPKTTHKIKNCNTIFFNNDSLYLIIENKLHKSSITEIENYFFIKHLPEKKILYIRNNSLFGWENNFFWEEKLTK